MNDKVTASQPASARSQARASRYKQKKWYLRYLPTVLYVPYLRYLRYRTVPTVGRYLRYKLVARVCRSVIRSIAPTCQRRLIALDPPKKIEVSKEY